MVNAETDSGPHQTSRRYLTVLIQYIILQNSKHQKVDRLQKFSEKHLMTINYMK